MAEQERGEFFDERFATLAAVQEGLAQHGYLFAPIAREHTEALVTGPLLHRIRTHISKRGMSNVAGKVIVAFSGYARDPRELFAIPEVRDYWRQLDTELPELPALLACFPELSFNGPGMHLMLLGEIETVRYRPAIGGYDVQVSNASQLIGDATQRIRQAGRKYRLNQMAVQNLIDHFVQGARSHR